MYYSEKEQNNEKNDRNERKEGWGKKERRKDLMVFLWDKYGLTLRSTLAIRTI